MLRIIIEVVPDGIEALKMTADRITLACKFPIDDSENQEMYVFGDNKKRYAELHGVNLENLLYAPPDGEPKYLELANIAITELLRQKTFRQGGEDFPCIVSLEPAEFDLKMAGILADHKQDIQFIRLFGRRVREEINFPNFITGLTKFSQGKYGSDIAIDGSYLLKEWPGYIPYELAIRLDPQLYKPFEKALALQHFTCRSQGEVLELQMVYKYCFRSFPNIPDMSCFNGLLFYFIRPDGSIFTPAVQARITKREGAHIAISGEYGEENDYTLESLKGEIKAGRLLYNKRLGLQKYPGAED